LPEKGTVRLSVFLFARLLKEGSELPETWSLVDHQRLDPHLELVLAQLIMIRRRCLPIKGNALVSQVLLVTALLGCFLGRRYRPQMCGMRPSCTMVTILPTTRTGRPA
jgi:hypothetical protein